MLFFEELVNCSMGGSIEQHPYCCPDYSVLLRVPKYRYGFSVHRDFNIYKVFCKFSGFSVSSYYPALYALQFFWRCSYIGKVDDLKHKHLIIQKFESFFGTEASSYRFDSFENPEF